MKVDNDSYCCDVIFENHFYSSVYGCVVLFNLILNVSYKSCHGKNHENLVQIVL